MALDSTGRAALRAHTETIARRTRLAHRAETLTRTAAGILAVATLAVAVLAAVASLTLARRWARHVSAPIEELVDWLGRIERHEPLPPERPRGAPEFASLRDAVRQLADALEHVRRQERERERLTAFRETARQVAHEMRGPLTAARLALRQLAAGDPSGARVLEDETTRLEGMARAFAEFGRLPEGPEAAVDVGELLADVLASCLPPGTCHVERNVAPGLAVRGHYEPLRRAVENLVRNAVTHAEAGGIAVTARRAPDGVQAKLLRVLEQRTIERVGSERARAVDVRVIAATNHDLAHGVAQGRFREDLYFRLNVFPVHVPPLRERLDDLPALVRRFAAAAGAECARAPRAFDPEALRRLARHRWPGNVRELANLIERLTILGGQKPVTPAEVDAVLGKEPLPAPGPPDTFGLAAALDAYERELIERALTHADGNVAEAARDLQTDRANLYRRMRRLGLSRTDT
jgi:signal transduction histidine kinase